MRIIRNIIGVPLLLVALLYMAACYFYCVVVCPALESAAYWEEGAYFSALLAFVIWTFLGNFIAALYAIPGVIVGWLGLMISDLED